jgi:uncharacterized membrane protein YbhN (UPF0104 family)
VKLLASVIIAGAFVWTLQRGGLPLLPPAEALKSIDLGMTVLYVVLMVAMHFVRSIRWRHLLAPVAEVPARRIIAVSFIGFGAILLMPLRAGEFVRPYMIRDKGKVTMAAATGTIGAERVIDGLFLTVLLGICLQLSTPLSPLPDHIGKLSIPVATVPAAAYLSLVGFISAFVLMGIFYWRPVLGHRIVSMTLGLISPRAAEKAADFVAKMADGLQFLPSARHIVPFLLETGVYWGLNGVSMWVLARGCGLENFSLLQAFVVMGVLGVGVLVPAGPGLFGAFQASIYAGLAMFFPDDVVLGPGAVFVFLIYLLQFVWTVLAAAFFLVVDRGAARAVMEAETGRAASA